MIKSRTSKRASTLILGILAVATGSMAVAPSGAVAQPLRGSQEATVSFGSVASRIPLDRVVGTTGLSATKLLEELRHDEQLTLDSDGNGVYEELPPPQQDRTATTAAPTAPFSTASTFTLHSKPTSVRKIYLDFDGHTVSGTPWNTQYRNGASFTAARFDLDGNPASFNAAEHAAIQRTYLRVKEDFEPFDVDVTTQDPGLEALRRTSSTDPIYGVRVLFTPTNVKGCSCGGYAYLTSFSWNTDTPAFVLTSSSASDKFMGEAASHEVGHTVGLSHDGRQTTTAHDEYYTGHANWAPIMGVGYYRGVSQWSRGEYAGATNVENDFTVMANNGLAWAADDVAGTTSTTAVLKDATSLYGTIGKTGDVDTYRVSFVVARTFRLKVWNATSGVDANLNARVIIRNSAGATVATLSPTSSLGVDSTITVQPGTYYVSVDGVGEGSASTGYTNYGSMGRYGINLTIV